MIVHSERDLDLEKLFVRLKTAKMTNCKINDELYKDLYDLINECKIISENKEMYSELIPNSDGYIIDEVSEITLYAKAHEQTNEDDVRNIKLCLKNPSNPWIEFLRYGCSPFVTKGNTEKINIKMDSADMEIYGK